MNTAALIDKEIWKDRNSVLFAIGVFVLCLFYYWLELKNGRAQMADFRVYYDAAKALAHDGQVYGKAFGVSSGFYKYSPMACLPFIPFTWLNYALASFVYYILLSIAIAWFLVRIARDLQSPHAKYKLALPLLTGLFLIDHLERELHLGNINLFLLIMLYGCYRLWEQGRSLAAGFMLGAVLLFKPHFVIMVPYFIWKRQFKALWAATIVLALGLMLPTLLIGFSKNTKLLFKWLGAMQDHNLALQKSPNTIYGLINHAFMGGHAGSWIIIIVLACVAAFFVFLLVKNDKSEGLPAGSKIPRYLEFFILVALVPNLVHTDTEHFMWTLPLIAFALNALIAMNSGPRKVILSALLLLAFIPYAVNSPDLVGKKVRLLFDEGLLGAANLIFIAVAIAISLFPRASVGSNLK